MYLNNPIHIYVSADDPEAIAEAKAAAEAKEVAASVNASLNAEAPQVEAVEVPQEEPKVEVMEAPVAEAEPETEEVAKTDDTEPEVESEEPVAEEEKSEEPVAEEEKSEEPVAEEEKSEEPVAEAEQEESEEEKPVTEAEPETEEETEAEKPEEPVAEEEKSEEPVAEAEQEEPEEEKPVTEAEPETETEPETEPEVESEEPVAEEEAEEPENVSAGPDQDKFVSFLSDGDVVLNFDHKNKEFKNQLTAGGCTVVDATSSATMCKMAGEFTGVSVQNLIFRELREKEKYNAIYGGDSIMHLNENQLPGMFELLASTLKADGVIYMEFIYGVGEDSIDGVFCTRMSEDRLEKLMYRVTSLVADEVYATGEGADKRLHVILKK